jgi:hypothetical protein
MSGFVQIKSILNPFDDEFDWLNDFDDANGHIVREHPSKWFDRHTEFEPRPFHWFIDVEYEPGFQYQEAQYTDTFEPFTSDEYFDEYHAVAKVYIVALRYLRDAIGHEKDAILIKEYARVVLRIAKQLYLRKPSEINTIESMRNEVHGLMIESGVRFGE